jgi:hypothetical protein
MRRFRPGFGLFGFARASSPSCTFSEWRAACDDAVGPSPAIPHPKLYGTHVRQTQAGYESPPGLGGFFGLVPSSSPHSDNFILTPCSLPVQDLDVQTELWESERQRSASLEREVTALSEQLRSAALGRRLGTGDDGAVASGGGMAGTLAAAFLNARGGGAGAMGAGAIAAGIRDMEFANVKLLEELNAAKDSALSARAETEALQ